MKVGTTAHRDLFCRALIDGHRDYQPEYLPWPNLESKHLERLNAFPFWGVAKAMERKAGMMVAAFADTLDDPVIREAVALQGVEEARHARLITHFIERYGLSATDIEIPTSAVSKDDFVVFGYEECVDFFMGAGLLGLASQLDIFPASFIDIFDNILIEEARHITFFVNWFRYEEARAGRDGVFSRHVVAAKNYFRSIRQLVRSFGGAQTTGFAAAGAKDIIAGITPAMFLEAALVQNRRMLALVDARLVRPAFLPTLALTALTALRALPPRPAMPGLTVAPPARALDAGIAA